MNGITMFKDAISGLDKIFEDDIPRGGIIMVTGTAGSLKSAFVYNLLSEYLKNYKNRLGVYVTLEETKKSHLKNMKSIGIELEPRLKVSDIASFREHIGFEQMDYLDLILKRVSDPLNKGEGTSQAVGNPNSGNSNNKDNNGKNPKERKLACFALDSLNALYSLMNVDKTKMRNKLLEFFATLRNKNLTSFIILEMSKDSKYSEEFFLADGIIEFGITPSPEKSLKRYIQVRKMRATRHSLDPFVIEVGKKGLHIVGKLLTQY
jgi:KaiC/GvpD/RAD55 family RecA-like ATPase